MSLDSFEDTDLEELPDISMINKPKSSPINSSWLICNKGKVKAEDFHLFIEGDNYSPDSSSWSEYMITFSQNNFNWNCSFEVQKSKIGLINKSSTTKLTMDLNHGKLLQFI